MRKIIPILFLTLAGLALANPAQQLLLAGGQEIITLSGTSGTPNNVLDLVGDPGTATAEWEFQSDGEVWQLRNNAADSQFQTGIEWSNKQPSPGTHYIEFTFNAGDAHNTGGLSTGTCYALSVNRKVGWTISSVGSWAGSVKVDIATDSGCTNIVATGYYGGDAEVSL